MRLRLDVSYDGTGFSGWADQPGLRTVQGTIEHALATVLRLPAGGGESSAGRLTVAGRTDAGVHARGQVCHVDVAPEASAEVRGDLARLVWRLSRLLPADVRVKSIVPAPEGFDARFSATWRRYAFRICDAPVSADPLHRHHVLDWRRRLDEGAMNAAAEQLTGMHDFAAYCKRREGATTIRTLRELAWSREGDVLTGRVIADAFCHHMVRSLVGALIAVGEGRQQVEWPAQVLAAGVRHPEVLVVPPQGLTLEEVGYPDDAELAARAAESRTKRAPT